ncbi:MAG: hypothetical protein HY747_01570 [Elusimicrobia bacterium]|nr:hypothetical protein [Elusimicrobiota bacterium]
MRSKLLFFPHGPQPYASTGPFWGSVGCFRDDTTAKLDSLDTRIDDRALLCVSEDQAKEWLKILEEAKNYHYLLEFNCNFPSANCQVIKEIAIDGRKEYWLAEVNPPLPGRLYKQKKDLPRVLLQLRDFPLPNFPLPVDMCPVDESAPIGDSLKFNDINFLLGDWEECCLERFKKR